MALKNNDNTGSFLKFSGKKSMLSSTIHLFFLTLGALLSIAAFLAVQSITIGVSDASYDRISEETSEIIGAEVSELEFSLRTVSTLMALSDVEDSETVIQRLENVGQSMGRFQKVFWLRKTQSEGWKLMPLFAREDQSSVQDFSALFQQSGLKSAISSSLEDDEQTFLVTELYKAGAEGVLLKSESGANMFALVRAIPSHRGNTGAIIAFTDLQHVFAQSFMDIDALVSRIGIRDVNSGNLMFSFEKRHSNKAEYDKTQSYDLNFSGHVWEITSQYYIQDSLIFLNIFPYMLLFVTLIITLTGTLYLRNNHMQAIRFADMNEMLGVKNKELESEVVKRERLHKTVKRAERENRAIIDSVSDIIFETDSGGKILFLNAQWSKTTDFDIEQSIGQNFFKMLHPQDQEQIQAEFEAVLKSKKYDFRTFTRLRTAQGSFRAVELSVSMVRENRRHEKRVVGTLTDVEERRRAERALSQAEKKYRNIVENAAGGIYQLTPEGVYLSANPAMARVLGYDAPEQILREVKNAYDSVYVDKDERERLIEDLRAVGSVTNHETQVHCRDGETIWVNENIRSVKDEGGNILYFEGSMEDISERKRASIALQDAKMHSDLANRAKSEFLANMSHELRTPLNAIIGFSEMIKNEVFGPLEEKAYWEYARDIHGSGQQLLSVINEILDISKIEAGERQLNEELIDVEACVYGCLDLLQNKVETGDIIVTNALEQVPNIVGESLAIKQVLMNLLSNAVKFTPSGGRVTISSELDRDGRLLLSVTDTGVGLDDAEIKKALSPFGQVNSEHNREGSGTGLGLTLVDALLKLHGAELELVSQKGIGTTATAIFPADRVQRLSKRDLPEKDAAAQEPEEQA